MKGNPAMPGGWLASKPTWSNTSGCSATSAFFVLGDARRLQSLWEGNPIGKLDSSAAHQIAQVASAFEQRRTGHIPKSVAVILSENPNGKADLPAKHARRTWPCEEMLIWTVPRKRLPLRS